ncbi:hypothetical protein DPM33_30860 [Mesorhizobium hawassense]|uniref:Uncharacterized protein n=1 Tax=Mesorhizobium hawassense TaxID=1209954 RepID=A0A330HAB7_9HYPH|nr:hypothetical protein [Mesorhizobium hawassense]RAZ84658.1 hypothetical protein DPM33_30860 [Mesorhizobium hawassense]
MLTADGNSNRHSPKNSFPASINPFLKPFVLSAIMAVSGCQYFNFGQPTSFSVSQSSNADLIGLKPNRVQPGIAPRPITRVSANPYLGNAAHICSPSGFGQQSHCFARATGPLSIQNI